MISPRQEGSLTEEMIQIQLSIELIEMGARIQMLESETSLNRNRLLKLYKEVKGESPPKGQLPFSADWYMTWLPNVHGSLFYSIYKGLYLLNNNKTRMELLSKSYRMYLDQLSIEGHEAVLGITRAWTLLRFIDGNMISTSSCKECNCNYLVHANEPKSDYVCGLCLPPSRAGKKNGAKR